jgi:hypothetical protein
MRGLRSNTSIAPSFSPSSIAEPDDGCMLAAWLVVVPVASHGE